jgi:hypothetical protein
MVLLLLHTIYQHRDVTLKNKRKTHFTVFNFLQDVQERLVYRTSVYIRTDIIGELNTKSIELCRGEATPYLIVYLVS